MEGGLRSSSVPFMDLDELPGGLVDVDDMYLGTYLNGVKADATVKTDFLPSLDLPDDIWGDIPAPLPGAGTALGTAPAAAPALGVGLAGVTALSDPGPLLASTSGNSRSNSDLNAKALLTMDSGRTHQASTEDADRHSDEDVAPASAPGSNKGRGRTRKITPQRQQNNRKAQQRYREKRKQQAADLDAKVAMLTAELDGLRGLQGRAEQLQEENERLRTELEKRGSGTTAATSSREASGEEPLEALEVARPDDATAPAQYDCLKEELRATSAQMSALLQRAALPTDAAKPDSSLPAAIAEELGVLLNKAEQLSLRMLLLAPACPLDKILSNLAAKGAEHPCTVFRARWMRTLEAMALSTEQQDALLEARQHALRELRRVYEQRTHLNQIAMSIMLPRQAPVSLADASQPDRVSTDGKIRILEEFGGCDMLSQSAQLSAALNDLKSNLAAERRLLAQMHGLIVQKVLSPTQSAVMFIQTNAHPIEPLHVTNLVASQRGQGVSSGIDMSAVSKEQQEALLTPYGATVQMARA